MKNLLWQFQLSIVIFLNIFFQTCGPKKIQSQLTNLARTNNANELIHESKSKSSPEPIIKNPSKDKKHSGTKHVKFSDQVLDDSIGAEPLDSNAIDNNCSRKGLKKGTSHPNASGAELISTFSGLYIICSLVFIIFHFNN